MDSKELELLIYLITSAQGLPGEPRIYGSIRLTEAASKLCQIILEKDPQNEGVRKLAERIDRCCPYAGKNTKLMNTGIHGYSKGVMNNQNQRHRYNQKHSQIKGYQ